MGMIILPLKKDVMSMIKLSTIQMIILKGKLTLNQITIHNEGSIKGKFVRSLLLEVKCNKIISMENFTENLIVLESLDIPLVLGNGWLCAHKGVIYATQWKIFLTAPSGKRVEYQRGPLLPEEAYPC